MECRHEGRHGVSNGVRDGGGARDGRGRGLWWEGCVLERAFRAFRACNASVHFVHFERAAQACSANVVGDGCLCVCANAQ